MNEPDSYVVFHLKAKLNSRGAEEQRSKEINES